MKTLYLLRHAKSSWSTAAVDDYDRPLNPRGERAAGLIGTYMAQNAFLPDKILCSSAKRARQTIRLILEHLPTPPEVVFDDALYLAAPARLMARVRASDNALASLMLVGHNPGLEQLALGLTGRGRLRETAARKFPTAGLAVLEFATGDWRDIAIGEGALTDFVTPKELA
jgi:phosphohistidine phosphatase